MDIKIKEIINEFDNIFGLSSLFSRPTGYMEYEEVYGRVKCFIEQSLQSYKQQIIQDLLDKLPKGKYKHWGSEIPSRNFDNGLDVGYNNCLEEIKQIIKNI